MNQQAAERRPVDLLAAGRSVTASLYRFRSQKCNSRWARGAKNVALHGNRQIAAEMECRAAAALWLVAELTDSGEATSLARTAIRFPKIEVKGNRLLLNGTPVKFHGISRLDEHPLLGRALTPEIDRLDMEMIKDASFNMVRATIAPPHPASLDYADKLGIYVENEGPTCWGARP